MRRELVDLNGVAVWQLIGPWLGFQDLLEMMVEEGRLQLVKGLARAWAHWHHSVRHRYLLGKQGCGDRGLLLCRISLWLVSLHGCILVVSVVCWQHGCWDPGLLRWGSGLR